MYISRKLAMYMRLPLLLSSLFFMLFIVNLKGQTAPPLGTTNDLENEPPLILAEGNQYYCPLSETPVVTDLDIVDPDTDEIKAFYIQISSGYEFGKDRLKLSVDHDGIIPRWNPSTGKLSLEVSGGGTLSYEKFIEAVKDVVFVSSDVNVSGEKFFSLTVGDVNYLPSTGHYYEYVSEVGITWTEARDKAELHTYNGLEGYLATITSADEAKLTGEQAEGAGWIGGSDAEEEGIWKWVTGPEAGTTFWIGNANGYAPNGQFAFWNHSEPNDLYGEDYAHVTHPDLENGILGSWNDLSNTGASDGFYQPKGYIVEYGTGGPDDGNDFAGSTRMYTSRIEESSGDHTCGPGWVTLTASAMEVEENPEESPIVIQWFDTADGAIPVHVGNTYTVELVTSSSFYVLVGPEGCTDAPREAVEAFVFNVPDIEKSVLLKNCDTDDNPHDGITEFNLETAIPEITKGDETLTVTFYLTEQEAIDGENPIPAFPYRNDQDPVYSRAVNLDGCFDTGEVSFEVSVTEPLDQVILESCDTDGVNDGLFGFDLTIATERFRQQMPTQTVDVRYYRNENDAALEKDEIDQGQLYKNEDPEFQSVFVRIDSQTNGDCLSIGPYLELYVFLLPEFDLIDEAIYCVESPYVEVQIENPAGNYNYEWRNEQGDLISSSPSAQINEPGQYEVIAISDVFCNSEPRRILIKQSSIADLSYDKIIVNDGGDSNSIEIIDDDLGDGIYEYALLGVSNGYQTEPLFVDVPPGIHQLRVRDQNGCGVSSIEVSVIGYPKFFTPNGDGIYDTWQVSGILFQPSSNIFIYDKFGKLLVELDPRSEGWDGVYNGRQMPSSDYWYMVQLEDGRTHRGHFSLIRR